MTDHQGRINWGGNGRWYAECVCGWNIGRAIEGGDATFIDGYIGRRREADAQALLDRHIARR